MKKKSFISFMLLVAIVFTSVGVFAGSTIQKITASIDYSVKVKLDGKDLNPKDAKGAALRPITYNNNLYLPISALNDALKVPFNYNSKSKLLTIGQLTDKIYLSSKDYDKDDKTNFEYTENKDLLFFNNNVYNRGWVAPQGGQKITEYSYFRLCFLPGMKYSKIGGTINVEEGTKLTQVYIKVRKGNDQDKEILAEFNVIPGTPFNFEIDLNGANWAIFEEFGNEQSPSNGDSVGNYAITDVYFK